MTLATLDLVKRIAQPLFHGLQPIIESLIKIAKPIGTDGASVDAEILQQRMKELHQGVQVENFRQGNLKPQQIIELVRLFQKSSHGNFAQFSNIPNMEYRLDNHEFLIQCLQQAFQQSVKSDLDIKKFVGLMHTLIFRNDFKFDEVEPAYKSVQKQVAPMKDFLKQITADPTKVNFADNNNYNKLQNIVRAPKLSSYSIYELAKEQSKNPEELISKLKERFKNLAIVLSNFSDFRRSSIEKEVALFAPKKTFGSAGDYTHALFEFYRGEYEDFDQCLKAKKLTRAPLSNTEVIAAIFDNLIREEVPNNSFGQKSDHDELNPLNIQDRLLALVPYLYTMCTFTKLNPERLTKAIDTIFEGDHTRKLPQVLSEELDMFMHFGANIPFSKMSSENRNTVLEVAKNLPLILASMITDTTEYDQAAVLSGDLRRDALKEKDLVDFMYHYHRYCGDKEVQELLKANPKAN